MPDETLEQLYREIFLEYEGLRENSYDINRRIPQIMLQSPMAHQVSDRLQKSVSNARNATRYKKGYVKDVLDEFADECFLVAASRKLDRAFTYDELMPHEHVQRGYTDGYKPRTPLDTKFHVLREITPERIGQLFYFLGTMYERAHLDPVEMATMRLERSGYLK